MCACGLSNVGAVSFITTQIGKRSQDHPTFAKAIQRFNLYTLNTQPNPYLEEDGMEKGLLRIEGFSGFQLKDTLRALNDLESAYNHILIFENILSKSLTQLKKK
jgi:hypothetical protein